MAGHKGLGVVDRVGQPKRDPEVSLRRGLLTRRLGRFLGGQRGGPRRGFRDLGLGFRRDPKVAGEYHAAVALLALLAAGASP